LSFRVSSTSDRSVDYRCDDGKTSWRDKRRHWCLQICLDTLFIKLRPSPPKTNRSARTCIEKYQLLTSVGTCQSLKQAVEPQFFTFL
jgi:hypothetical protein